MKFIKNNLVNIIILLIFAIGVYIRTSWYGDLRLSVANAETGSYISSSRNSILSWKIFAGQRLFTTNLLYKVANDPVNCPITSFGKPALGEETERKIQPCFDKIALFQNYLAIFGWCFLGWMMARWLTNPFIKITAATLIMLFGFTPQIAEWDSVLSPESLSLSMFAIILGIAIELGFRAANSETPLRSTAEKLLLVLLVVTFLLWVFVRDVHLYAIPISIALLAPLFFVNKFRGTKKLPITLAILFFFFVIGFLSARDSLRATRFPLINSLDAYIWPYPTRVEFFKEYGMPARDDGNYQEWADENATKAYGIFLATHPGFVITTLWDNMDLLNDDYAQPYFFSDEIKYRDSLLVIGEMVNPETGSVYLLTLLLAITLVIHAISKRTPTVSVWAWLALWVYGIAAATLFISYFGDTAGLRRHIMPSVELFRLHLWVFLLPFLDISLNKETE